MASVGPLMDWALRDDPDQGEQLDALLETAAAAGSGVVVCVGPMSDRPLPSLAETIDLTTSAWPCLLIAHKGAVSSLPWSRSVAHLVVLVLSVAFDRFKTR